MGTTPNNPLACARTRSCNPDGGTQGRHRDTSEGTAGLFFLTLPAFRLHGRRWAPHCVLDSRRGGGSPRGMFRLHCAPLNMTMGDRCAQERPPVRKSATTVASEATPPKTRNTVRAAAVTVSASAPPRPGSPRPDVKIASEAATPVIIPI